MKLLSVFSIKVPVDEKLSFMSRWRTMHQHTNMAACEQAPSSQFGVVEK
jgi:hypothetical protein